MAFNYSPKIVTDGLVLYLDAGNRLSYPGSGTTWTDLSRSQTNGTLVNGPTYNTGSLGSIVFDGTDDYATGFDSISINTTSSFSVEFWFNLTAFTDAYPTLLQIKTNTVYSCNLALSQVSDYLGIIFGSAGSWARIKTDNVPSTGVWNHVIITYNGSGEGTISNYKAYLNTIEQTLSAAGGFNTTGQVNYIGTTNAASRGIDDFLGRIAICKVYNKSLSSQEVLQNYNATKTRFGL